MRRYAPFSLVTREALAYACASLQLSLEDGKVDALMQEYRKLAMYPEVAQALAKLKVKQAILSNGSPEMLDPLVRHSGLKFDAVLSVDELKVFKPAPEVYQLAVDRLGVAKERVGFVSSNCWDALGAKSFGFRVYWINRLKAPVDQLGFQPDAIVGSLNEVLP
jgi:2-haloacid dehalogenase